MEFFNDLSTFNQVSLSIIGGLLLIALTFWIISEIMGGLIHKRQRDIYRDMSFFSTMDELTRAQNDPYYEGRKIDIFTHTNLFRVYADFKVKDVVMKSVCCGYLVTYDVEDENFDVPFNKFLTDRLVHNDIFHPTNIDEITFTLKGVYTNSDIKYIKRKIGLDASFSTVSPKVYSTVRKQFDKLNDAKSGGVKPLHMLHSE